MDWIKLIPLLKSLVFRYSYTYRLLVILLVIGIVLSLYICEIMKPNELLDVDSKQNTLIPRIILSSIVCCCITFIWLWGRRIPRFRGGKVGVLFAPTYSYEVKADLLNLEEKLRVAIKSKDLSSSIVVKKLCPIHKLVSHAEKETMLVTARASVLISGIFEEFTEKGKKITGFSSVSITFKNLPVPLKKSLHLMRDALWGKIWYWDADNTIKKNVVADNLSEVARYIIGLCLVSKAKFDKAEEILGLLMLDVNAKNSSQKTPIEIRRFMKTIQRVYVITLVEGVYYAYKKLLLAESMSNATPKILEIWIVKLEMAIKYDENNIRALMAISILSFWLNDIDKSKSVLHQARQKLSSKDLAACDFSEAFLLMYSGDFDSARKLYKRTIKKYPEPNLEMMTEIFQFLEHAALVRTDKPQIKYIQGLLQDEYGDKIVAREDYENFIKKASGHDAYSRLVKDAEGRLKRIQVDEAEDA